MTNSSNSQEAEAIAIEALQYIAQNETLLERFFAISGTSPANLRQAAQEPGFMAAVLNFLLNHQPDLMDFCNYSDIKPQKVAQAFALLSGVETLGC